MKTSRLKHQVVAALAALSLVGTASAEVPLPADYVPLEWIESFGKEFINTGYMPLGSSPFVAEIRGNFTQYAGSYQLMGTTSGPRSDWGIGPGQKWNMFDKNDGAVADFAEHVFVSRVNDTAGNAEFVIDGQIVHSQTVATTDSIRYYILFARHVGSTGAINCQCCFRMRSCRLSQNGVPVRDFVPCRSIQGAAGLWDKVEGIFYPNNASSGAFKGPDDGDALLNYLGSSASVGQYVNTDYKPLGSSPFVAEIRGRFTDYDAGSYRLMGTTSGPRSDWGIGPGKKWNMLNNANGPVADFEEHVFVSRVKDNAGNAEFVIDGQIVHSQTVATENSTRNYILFARQLGSSGAINCHCSFRMRSCRLSQGGVPVRDYIPMLKDGKLGLYDRQNDKPYPNNGSGTFTYGFSYVTNETTLLVREGAFAADENFFGFGSVEKTGGYRINAADCRSYPANLKLAQGFFSQQDNAANSYSVDGTLAISGGMRLAVDWVGTSCDSFSATAVDLSEASEENPVVVLVNAAAATLDPAHPVVLLTSGAVQDDEKKFVASGIRVQFEVEDGKLLMRFADPELPLRAEWTGLGDRGKVSDGRNWNCYNFNNELLTGALPTDKTAVTVPANLAGKFEWLEGETLAYRSFDIPSSVTLEQDCDWRGMAALPSGKVTLNGHKLYVKSLAGPSAFTDSSVPGGELVVDVPTGQELIFPNGMKLEGTLKLVKIGDGTMGSPREKNQTFNGGVDVRGGTVNADGWGTDIRWGATGNAITVSTNGVFEMQGMVNFSGYGFVLNGGTLKSSTQPLGSWGKAWQLDAIKSVRVDADSTIDFTTYYSIMNYANGKYGKTTIDLQGHTLTVYFRTDMCYLSNVEATRGTMVLNGTIQFIGGDFYGPETTFDLYGYLTPEVDVHIGTYICRTTSGSSERDKNVYVYERFKPITDMFWGCILKDGATLDLSTREGAWSVKSTFDHKVNDKKIVKFEDHATITVDLGDRKLKSGDLVVAWDGETRPSNLSTLTFKLAAGQRGTVIKTTDGLRFRCGMTILVR